MKAKYIIGIFLILLMATTACVYAADATVGDYKFTIPDGFELSDPVTNGVTLKNSDGAVISFNIETDAAITADTAAIVIQGLEDQGYTVTKNETFKYNDTEILEIDYEVEGGQFYLYTWQVKDGECAVAAYGLPSGGDAIKWEDSPVKSIFDTITKA